MLRTITVVSKPMPLRKPAHSRATSEQHQVEDYSILILLDANLTFHKGNNFTICQLIISTPYTMGSSTSSGADKRIQLAPTTSLQNTNTEKLLAKLTMQ